MSFLGEITFIGWVLILWFLISASVYGALSWRKKKLYPLIDFFTISLTVGSIGFSLQLIWRMLTDEQLQNLGLSVLIPIFIGVFASIWIGISTILASVVVTPRYS